MTQQGPYVKSDETGDQDQKRKTGKWGICGCSSGGVRGGADGAADSGVVERDDPPRGGQRVDQRRVPVVQVLADVLEQDQRRPVLVAAAGVAVGVVDAVRGTDLSLASSEYPSAMADHPFLLAVLLSEPAAGVPGLRQGMHWSSP